MKNTCNYSPGDENGDKRAETNVLLHNGELQGLCTRSSTNEWNDTNHSSGKMCLCENKSEREREKNHNESRGCAPFFYICCCSTMGAFARVCGVVIVVIAIKKATPFAQV